MMALLLVISILSTLLQEGELYSQTNELHDSSPHLIKYRAAENFERCNVGCTAKINREKTKIMEQSQCGEPKDVFVELDTKGSHEQVNPRSVWVKRCVGMCDYEYGKCVASETKFKYVPTRIYDVTTNKESCVTFPVEEHVKCGCCDGASCVAMQHHMLPSCSA